MLMPICMLIYGTEDSQDPICAKSRTGYVLLVAGCPLMWVSKLQSKIASSTIYGVRVYSPVAGNEKFDSSIR